MLAWKMVLLIVGVLAFVIALCAITVWMEKRFPSKEYDERQKIAKGRGYRLSFWVGMVYYLAVAIVLIGQVDGEKTVEPYLLVMIGLILQAMVDHTYCLFTHSALPLSQNRVVTVFGYVVCGTLQLVQFRILSKRGGLALVGHGSSPWICLIAGCCFFYLTVLHVIQALMERKD